MSRRLMRWFGPPSAGRALVASIALLGWPMAASAQFTLPGVRTETPPVIDGVLAEGEWSKVAPATGFVQFEPRRGEPSPFRTEALVLYDKEHIYVAFRAWETAEGPGHFDRDLLSDILGIVWPER